MKSDDSLPILTDLIFDFPTLTPSTLGQPIEPIVSLLSPPSITIPSNPASPDEQSDSVSTTQATVSSTTTAIIYQLPPSTISPIGDARSKITSFRKIEINLSRNYASYNALPIRTINVATDSQLPGSTKENTSLDSRELQNTLVLILIYTID